MRRHDHDWIALNAFGETHSTQSSSGSEFADFGRWLDDELVKLEARFASSKQGSANTSVAVLPAMTARSTRRPR